MGDRYAEAWLGDGVWQFGGQGSWSSLEKGFAFINCSTIDV